MHLGLVFQAFKHYAILFRHLQQRLTMLNENDLLVTGCNKRFSLHFCPTYEPPRGKTNNVVSKQV